MTILADDAKAWPEISIHTRRTYQPCTTCDGEVAFVSTDYQPYESDTNAGEYFYFVLYPFESCDCPRTPEQEWSLAEYVNLTYRYEPGEDGF